MRVYGRSFFRPVGDLVGPMFCSSIVLSGLSAIALTSVNGLSIDLIDDLMLVNCREDSVTIDETERV